MARNSYASSGLLSTSSERHSRMTERFQVLRASLDDKAVLQTRLQQQRRRLSLCDSGTFVSTAIAPNGTIAAATLSEVRLYDTEKRHPGNGIEPCGSLHLRAPSKGESIQAIAISDHLLAVVTHLRLIVVEHEDFRNTKNNILDTEDALDTVRFDRKASWTPKSLSIIQVASKDFCQSAAAWVAVGGEGVSGVKLFQYSQMPSWNALRNNRLNLKCPQNTGLVQSVGFSTFVRKNWFMVFAVTSENRVACWKIHSCERDSPTLISRTDLDANATQDLSLHGGGITAVSIFETPSRTPYILVAINQKHGSQLVRSFIAPIGTPSSQWRPLSDKVAGRQIMSAAATPNGHFLVVVEDGLMRLLTLRGGYEGGVTCREHSLQWHSSLKATAKDICAISLSVKEASGCIKVTGVDGRGHLVSARVDVADMPVAPAPTLVRRPLETMELPNSTIVRELDGETTEAAVRVDSAVHESGEIMVMLAS